MEVRTRTTSRLTRMLSTLLILSGTCVVWAEAHAEGVAVSGLPGKELVCIHCVRCHQAPEPTDVSKELWPKVLAEMGLYLGLKGDELPDFLTARPVDMPFSDYNVEKTLVDTLGNETRITSFGAFVLTQPIISESDFLSIRNYFVDNAVPMAEMVLPKPDHPIIEGFTPSFPALDIEPNSLVFTTLVDEENQRLQVGRATWNIRITATEKPDDLIALDLKTGKRIGYTELPTDGFTQPKTYHGLRIYRNNGDLTFTESYFYPMHGALKSAITHYDGDADIALIAQYPRWEWETPHTFVYLENKRVSLPCSRRKRQKAASLDGVG